MLLSPIPKNDLGIRENLDIPVMEMVSGMLISLFQKYMQII